MTVRRGVNQRVAGEKFIPFITGTITVCMLGCVFLIAVFMSDELAKYVVEGLRLALGKVIPTALPFMIISDIILVYARPERIPLLGKAFSFVLGAPPSALTAVLIGNICGFPIGGKITSELYARGAITKSDGEKLLAYSNNPSPSFIIGSVGGIMYGDMRVGLLLLGCVYLSTLISAQFFRGKYTKNKNAVENIQQKYDLVLSIKNAGSACVTIASFIIIFACVVGIIENHVGLEVLRGILIAFTEVTGASDYFSVHYAEALNISVALVGFSLGFGGISVLFQTASFAKDAGLSMRKYLVIKLIEGAASALLALIGMTFLDLS